MKKIVSILFVWILALTLLFTSCSLPEIDINVNPSPSEEAAVEDPTIVLTLDVNPSFRFVLNENDVVIEVEGLNEDAENVLQEVENLVEQNIDTVLDKIVEKLIEKEYITEEDPSILITVENDGVEEDSEDPETTEETEDQKEQLKQYFEERSNALLEKAEKQIQKVYEKHELQLEVIEQALDEVDEELQKLAEEHQVSCGRFAWLKELSEEAPELDLEELTEMKVADVHRIYKDICEQVQNGFEKVIKHIEAEEQKYLTKDEVIELCAQDLITKELITSEEDLESSNAWFTYADKAMAYSVVLCTETKEYTYTVDAKEGTFAEEDPVVSDRVIIDTSKIEELKEELQKKTDDLINKAIEQVEKAQETLPEQFNSWKEFFEQKYNETKETVEEKITSTKEAIQETLSYLELQKDAIRKSAAELIESDDGNVYKVTIKTSKDSYVILINVEDGEILSVLKNGEEQLIEDESGETEGETTEEDPAEEETETEKKGSSFKDWISDFIDFSKEESKGEDPEEEQESTKGKSIWDWFGIH